MPEKLSLPSPKRWLIELNEDLEKVLRKLSAWDDSPVLSDLEFYVLMLEDRRFFRHEGFDIVGILREVLKAVSFKRYGGASTVDMQFVRTATGNYEISIPRKIREILLSYLLRFHAKKEIVLRSYLMIAYFGTGLKGADAASYALFSCPAFALRGERAAFLASVLLSPCPSVLRQPWADKVTRRAAYALKVGATYEERFQKVGKR